MSRLLALVLLAACTRPQPPDGSCEPGAAPGPDTPRWYEDADADGAGSDVSRQACEAPDGFVAAAGDCDDGNSTIFPGAGETCDGVDQDCDGAVDDDASDAPAWHPDVDGDGYGDAATEVRACEAPAGALADASDCDDGDAAVHPDAVEWCNTVDDDCDGLVDDADAVEDPATWFADLDGDGFGDADNEILACWERDGLTTDTTDCDDTRADVYPGATEVCDGVDGDCDGRVDDAAVDAGVWYVDGDGDGHGTAGFSVTACDAPASFVAEADDCDDGNALVFPDAVEICDGLDGDCDGVIDDAAIDATTWYPDLDTDGFADASAGVSACERPTDWLLLEDATDCDDTDAAVHPDAVEGCDDGVDANCDGYERPCALASSIAVGGGLGDVWYGETPGARAGESVAWADTNGDGRDEAIVGVFQDSSVETFAGAAYVIDAWGAGAQDLLDAPVKLAGTVALSYAGKSVAGAGDVDGDGYGDLLVGAHLASTSADEAGAAFLVSGPAASMDLVDATATMYGEGEEDNAGTSVHGVGDLDGDGYADIAVGAPGYDGTRMNTGAVYVLAGPVTGEIDLGAADSRLLGEAEAHGVGKLGTGGDVDGDGIDDFVVGGASADTARGVVYLVTEVPSGDSSLADAEARFEGLAEGEVLGFANTIAGDVNADGYADLLLGAQHASVNGTLSGTAYLVLGPVLGDFDLAASEAIFHGDAAGDIAGFDVSTAGDIDGDTRADLLVGAPGNDEAGTTGGAVYVILGPIAGTSLVGDVAYAKLLPHTGVTESGSSLAGGGDLDGDGQFEVLWGAPDYGYYRGGAGGAFVLPGTEL